MVTTDTGSDNLASDLLVGFTNNESVFWSIILIVILDNQVLTLLIISKAITSSTELNLETGEVSTGLLYFNPGHMSQERCEKFINYISENII